MKKRYSQVWIAAAAVFRLPFLLLPCLFLLANSALGEVKPGCVSGNCVNGFGEYVYPGGDSYTGFWKEGIRYGRGTYRFADGSRFIGSYANDRRHGAGHYIHINGQEIRGQWAMGRFVNNKRLAGLQPSADDTKLTPDEKARLQAQAMRLMGACTDYSDEMVKELTYLRSVRRSDFDELYFKLKAHNADNAKHLAGALELTLKFKKYHRLPDEQGIEVEGDGWGSCEGVV